MSNVSFVASFEWSSWQQCGELVRERHDSVIVTDDFNLSRERTYLINITEVPS